VSLEGEGAFAELALKILSGFSAGRFVIFQDRLAIEPIRWELRGPILNLPQPSDRGSDGKDDFGPRLE
jgi:hypothetical protein